MRQQMASRDFCPGMRPETGIRTFEMVFPNLALQSCVGCKTGEHGFQGVRHALDWLPIATICRAGYCATEEPYTVKRLNQEHPANQWKHCKTGDLGISPSH